MSERKINLEEIYKDVTREHLRDSFPESVLEDKVEIFVSIDEGIVVKAMMEACKQALELAAESAYVVLEDKNGNGTHAKIAVQECFKARVRLKFCK